jgi:hypothetical protein
MSLQVQTTPGIPEASPTDTAEVESSLANAAAAIDPDNAGENDETVCIELNFKAFSDHSPPTRHARREARSTDPSIQDFADQALELAALRAELKRLTRDYDALQQAVRVRDLRLQVLQEQLASLRGQTRNATREAPETQSQRLASTADVAKAAIDATQTVAALALKLADIAAKPADAPKLADTAAKPADATKPADAIAKPAETALKLAQTAAKPAELAAKPAEIAAKPAEIAAKPAVVAAKPAAVVAKPADAVPKPVVVTPPTAAPAPLAPAAAQVAAAPPRVVPSLTESLVVSEAPVTQPSSTVELPAPSIDATTPIPELPVPASETSVVRIARIRQLVPLDHHGDAIALTREIMTVGRTRDNDICIPSRAVSRDHARLVMSARSVTVFDMGSANGCFVNDEPFKRHKLREGDVLRIGDRSYRYTSE